jgi:hypothetical protein
MAINPNDQNIVNRINQLTGVTGGRQYSTPLPASKIPKPNLAPNIKPTVASADTGIINDLFKKPTVQAATKPVATVQNVDTVVRDLFTKPKLNPSNVAKGLAKGVGYGLAAEAASNVNKELIANALSKGAFTDSSSRINDISTAGRIGAQGIYNTLNDLPATFGIKGSYNGSPAQKLISGVGDYFFAPKNGLAPKAQPENQDYKLGFINPGVLTGREDIRRDNLSAKGTGFLGNINGSPSGNDSDITEYSTGVGVPDNYQYMHGLNPAPAPLTLPGHKYVDIPSVVPGLTPREINSIQQGEVTDDVYNKAVKHAADRQWEGKPVFARNMDIASSVPTSGRLSPKINSPINESVVDDKANAITTSGRANLSPDSVSDKLNPDTQKQYNKGKFSDSEFKALIDEFDKMPENKEPIVTSVNTVMKNGVPTYTANIAPGQNSSGSTVIGGGRPTSINTNSGNQFLNSQPVQPSSKLNPDARNGYKVTFDDLVNSGNQSSNDNVNGNNQVTVHNGGDSSVHDFNGKPGGRNPYLMNVFESAPRIYQPSWDARDPEMERVKVEASNYAYMNWLAKEKLRQGDYQGAEQLGLQMNELAAKMKTDQMNYELDKRKNEISERALNESLKPKILPPQYNMGQDGQIYQTQGQGAESFNQNVMNDDKGAQNRRAWIDFFDQNTTNEQRSKVAKYLSEYDPRKWLEFQQKQY